MQTVENVLRNEKNQLERIIEEAKKRLQNVPEGKIHIVNKGNKSEYYLINSKNNAHNGKYIKKGEMKLARRIVQRDYDNKVVKKAKERIEAIEKFLKKYETTSLSDLYNKTHKGRKELIIADVLSDEEYIRQWQSEVYKGKKLNEEKPSYITEKGESVRSKSEKIIADKLFMHGIPYKYEHPVKISNFTVYPDFTILRVETREEVYLEHFGMMDNTDYVSGMIKKINTYETNGIYLGVNLFATFETGQIPLNVEALERLIENCLI